MGVQMHNSRNTERKLFYGDRKLTSAGGRLLLLVPTSRRWNLNFRDGDEERKLHFAGGESETVQSKNFRDAGGDRKLTSAGGVTETVQMHNSRNTERKLFYGDRKLTSAGGR